MTTSETLAEIWRKRNLLDVSFGFGDQRATFFIIFPANHAFVFWSIRQSFSITLFYQNYLYVLISEKFARMNLVSNSSDWKFQVRGIILDRENSPEQFFENVTGGCNLSRLQLLRAHGDIAERLFSAVQLPQLIYLRWSNCRFSTLPSSFLTRNLRVLYIEGMHLETLWQHESEVVFFFIFFIGFVFFFKL